MLPAEKELRAALARFAEVRIEHDVRPTGRTSLALEDAERALRALTGGGSTEDALCAADALLERFRADREAAFARRPETLAA
ncbi:DUF5133 domain-containing protein [Streptomyces mangrovisoli]|uniref:DUF5133 domain-containing protein n=1 Tax=Streptomyces mangrovisoli TaxID=1428628 RepID=A0A1J4P0D7_9ACTN|nr:DUF5133 domain-containing protein [Streptomyces mangrovisoli]OIJ68056.1 DUF5133 domain-containing protein [Streptomyces mangrovisoli]